MEIMYEWAIQFAKGMGYVWDWLISPIDINGPLETILNYIGIDEIVPIYLVVGSACIFGLIRRLA